MKWKRVTFKGKRVWAAVDEQGRLAADGGRVPIRYSDKANATVYRAGLSRIESVAGEGPRELPPGRSADAAGGSRSKRGSSGFGSAGRRTAAQAAAARAQASRDLAAIPEGTHVAFTDGACRGNPGPTGAGAVVRLGDGTVLERGLSLGRSTNNVGELTAVGLALDLLEAGGVQPQEAVVLHTDSKYTLGVLTQGWKAKANRELILGLRERLSHWTELEVRWVAGHVGIPENERADELASAAAR